MADTCAHAPCTCDIGAEGLKGEDGRGYCSAGCLEGGGCVCPGCGCNMDTTDGDASSVPAL